MHNAVTLVPGTVIAAPAPSCVAGKILVHRVHAFVPWALFASLRTRTGWIDRLRRRYPRSLLKVGAYLRTEGARQTWAKIRSRVDLERIDASRGAFAAVGVVVQDARGCWAPGTPVMCWSWSGPIDADVHLVAPEQCLAVPDLRASYAQAPFLGWIASVLRTLPGGVASCTLVGLDPTLLAPLTALVGLHPSTGHRVVVLCGQEPAATSGAGVRVVRLCSDRAVAPLVQAESSALTARLPDPSHYLLDPYYPGPPELPAPFAREAVGEALAVLVRQSGAVSPTSDAPPVRPHAFMVRRRERADATSGVTVSCLGAGNYVRAVLLHQLRRHTAVHVRGVMDIRPEVAARQAEALDADFCTTDAAAVLEDARTALVMIASDHASHAGYAAAALAAGKAVHLEKPPAVTRDQLDALIQALRSCAAPRFHLGYNRPHAPAVVDLQRQLDTLQGPTVTTCTVHGYRLSRAHWYRWPNQGTRIAGNLVHWIDLGYRLGGRRRPVWIDLAFEEPALAERESLVLAIGFEDGGTDYGTVFGWR